MAGYLVNKPLLAAGISEDIYARGWEIVRKINNFRGQMWNFEDNLLATGIILRYTSKSERGLFIFYNPMINFFIPNMLGRKEKQKKEVGAVRLT